MAHHSKRTRTDSSNTATCPSSLCYLLAIPKDLSVSSLRFLGVTELCLHCAVSKYSKHLALSALKLTKIAWIDMGGNCSLDLIKAVGNRCTQLSYLTLNNKFYTTNDSTLAVLRQALSRLPTVRVSVSSHESLAEILDLFWELNIQVEEIYGIHGWSRFAPTLKVLRFCRSEIEFLPRCRNLEVLCFWPKPYGEMVCLAKCLKLRSLTLSGISASPGIITPYLPAMTEFCPFLYRPRLEMIVNSMQNLVHLFLSNMYSYGGAESRSLGSLKHLKSLRICLSDGLDKLIGSCAQLELLVLLGDSYDVLEAFLQVKAEDVNVCAWEWLYLIGYPDAGDEAVQNLVRKLEIVAPKLINVCVHYRDLKRSGEPKLNTVAPWFGEMFKMHLRDIRTRNMSPRLVE